MRVTGDWKMACGIAGLMAAAVCAVTSTATGQTNSAAFADSEPSSERPRVLLEVSSETRDLLPLLRAELEDLNLRVIERTYDGTTEPGIPDAIQREGSIPFRVVVTRKSVEVWIFDPQTARITLREIFNKVDGAPLEARTTVLHAVELLRWSLSEHDPARAPERRATGQVAARPASNESTRNSWSAEATALLGFTPGGTSPGAGAAMGVAWRPSRIGARLFAASLFAPNRLSLPEGEMHVTPSWFGLEGIIFSESPRNPLRYELGVGLAALSVNLHGVSSSNLDAHADDYASAAPILDLRVHVRISNALSLGVAATSMVPFRSDVLRIDDREVGRYGKLIATLGIGLELNL